MLFDSEGLLVLVSVVLFQLILLFYLIDLAISLDPTHPHSI